MTARSLTIVATSIGFCYTGHGEMDWRLGPAYGLAASLARAGDSPRVCLVATAVGDDARWLLAIYAAFGRAGWRASHLALFPQPNVPDIQEHLLAQDVIWVAGGSVANLLALWRLHGVGPAKRGRAGFDMWSSWASQRARSKGSPPPWHHGLLRPAAAPVTDG